MPAPIIVPTTTELVSQIPMVGLDSGALIAIAPLGIQAFPA
jgi:hypothetical protein